MYITKLVYAEFGDLPREMEDFLRQTNTLVTTDYNTDELSADEYQNLKEAMTIEPDTFDKSWEDVRQELVDSLGADVIEALEKEEIDLVMFV